MAEKRKAKAQSLNDATLEGDSDVGSGRAMRNRVPVGVRQRGDPSGSGASSAAELRGARERV